MNKPLLALAGLIVAGGTAGGALLVASSGGEEEVVQQVASATASPEAALSPSPEATATSQPEAKACDPTATTPPGMKLWRWGDVTVLLPDEARFLAFPEAIPPELKPPSGGFGLNIRSFDPSDNSVWSSVLVDAETGSVVRENVRPEDERSMQIAKETVAICSFDPAKAPWPYTGQTPSDLTRETAFGMSFIRPDPATGMFFDYFSGSGARRGEMTPADCEAVYQGLGLRNRRSSAGIGLDSQTGSLCTNISNVHPEDLAAFERVFSEVKRCNDIGC